MTSFFRDIFNKLTFIFSIFVLPLLNNWNFPAKIMILIGLCKYFHIIFLLSSFYFTSTLNLSIFYHNSTSQISVPYSAIRAPYSTIRVPYSAIRVSVCSSPSSVFIPSVGNRLAACYRRDARMFYSQTGNISFPRWE